ncbi:hypothetical protein IPN35_01440 [Candidatus Peregrinibacteria bacterium]|nr:MAG: hypothetical protein IPN35_01440 [Candidatus Peregrinibacteria bacterium]
MRIRNLLGVPIYFTSPSGNLNSDEELVVKHGGQVILPRKNIDEHGFISIVMDTEGNHIGIHSMI